MDDRQRIESLFEAALELEPERRRDFVSAACGDNGPMRDAVLRLLAGHDRAGVLDGSAAAFMDADRPPERLGAYRLLREIGRGGMGTVYDAERDDGQFRRRVAIKIIRAADPELQRRFLDERQILAALDHPHIARLLDGGVAPDGSPYIVMEYVEGLPIDVYCERMRLTVVERLRLFALIARTVEFAHRNLVIHCDLKPSNILVTPDGRAKLLDFGVAKLLNPWLVSDAGTSRQSGMTQTYASPEQLRGEAVVTSSDVYSLGVLLYELLTGRRPYEHLEVTAAEHAAAVLDGTIELPGTRVLRDEQMPSRTHAPREVTASHIARARQTTVRRLAHDLSGDVDAIVAMALRVEPSLRYGSAELLAQDVDRHLDHRPVRARERGRVYVARKLMRRHRMQAAVIGAAAIAVVGGGAAAAWQAGVARQERERAETALERSEQVADFLLELFNTSEQTGQQTLTGRDLVRRGSARIDQLAGQPDVQAHLLGALGSIYENLGEFGEGQRATERAISILEARGAAESDENARLLVQLGTLMRRLGEYDSAQALYIRARDMQERVLDPADPEIGRTLHLLASIAVYRGDFAEGERRAREAVTLLGERLGPAHRMRVNVLTQLGAIQRSRGDLAGAEQTFREAIRLRPSARGSTRHEILNDRFQLAGLIQRDPARSAEAEARFRAELPLLREEDPDDVYFITWGEAAIADLLVQRGDLAGAERLRRHIHELRLGTFGADHPSTAEATLLLGHLLLRRDRLEEAEQLLREAVQGYVRAYGDRHPSYANALMYLADGLERRGAYAAADSVIATAQAIRLDRYGPQSHGYIEALRRRAGVQLRLQQYATAESLLRQALEQTAEAPESLTQTARAVHRDLAALYEALGRPADARRHRGLADPPSD